MQKILLLFKRLIAKTIPQDIAAGRAGGIDTVIKLRPLSTTRTVGTPIFIWTGADAQMPRRAIIAIIPTNLNPSE